MFLLVAECEESRTLELTSLCAFAGTPPTVHTFTCYFTGRGGGGECGPTFPVEEIGVVTAALYLLGRLVRGMLIQLLPQVVVDEALVIDLLGPT